MNSLETVGSDQQLRAFNRTRGETLAETLALALGPWSRLRGFIGRAALQPGEGLLLRPCRGVHTMLMRFPIDVAFLDRDGRVVGVSPALRPWRMTPFFPAALAALELPAGRLTETRTACGDLVELLERGSLP